MPLGGGDLATTEALPINEFTPVFRDIRCSDAAGARE